MGNDRGMALVGVIILSALLMTLAFALAVQVGSDTQLRGAFASSVSGFYAAESGLNQGMGEYRNIFLEYNVPNGGDFDERTFPLGEREVSYQLSERPGNPQNIVIPSGEVFAGLNAIQYRYIVNSHATDVNGDIEAAVGAEFLVGYIPLFQFVAFYQNDLEISPGPTMNLEGRVHTNGDLYLNGDAGPLRIRDNPPANVLTVQVSAGGTVYRGRKRADQCQGTVYVDKLEDISPKDGNLDELIVPCSGSGTREVPVSELALWKGSMLGSIGNIAVPEPDIITKGTGVYWEKADLRIVLVLDQPDSLPGGPQLPHAIEVQDATGARDGARTTALHQFMADAAWNNGSVAGRGPSTLPGTMPIFYTDVPRAACGCVPGTEVCGSTTPTCYTPIFPAAADPSNGGGGVGDPLRVYSHFMDSNPVPLVLTNRFDLDYRRGGFYNHREDEWMQLLNINVSDLIRWNTQNGEPFFATTDNSEGGLVIFASVEGPASGGQNPYGVRVFGSANLPLPGGIDVSPDPTGVTVVSDQAIYVLGDFNRGPVLAGDLPRQPASLVGDSVNVLSSRYWLPPGPLGCAANVCCNGNLCRDGQSVNGLGAASRDAAATWINAAFLGGVDTTPDGFTGDYNGGLENYPRFHEDWAGVTLTYQGSFVSLGEPEHVNGLWQGTGVGFNIYNPPNRNWNFDPAYNNAANLPPLTPRFVYVQQVLFTEDFK
ncbi:MAG: hypothetical protein ACRERC_05050 [Candidatus Binatia bacterium]